MILAWLLHVIYATSLAFLLANIFGGLKLWISIVSLVVGAYFGWSRSRSLRAKNPDWRFNAFSVGQ